MKQIIFLVVLLIFLHDCHARTVGCFGGVIYAESGFNAHGDYQYYNDQLKQYFFRNDESRTNSQLNIEVQKKNAKLLPFLGCGISFDF